eukprot:2883344-Pyramimonas_sp.AAC.1
MDYLAFITKYPSITVELPVSTRQISLSVRSSHGTWYLAASRPAGNVVGNCEILSYLRSSRRYFARSPIPLYGCRLKGSESQTRRCGRSYESSWLSSE